MEDDSSVSVQPADEPCVKDSLTVGEAEFAEVESLQSLWFVFESWYKVNENRLYFQCVMCQPETTAIKEKVSCVHNLKCHNKRKHPVEFSQFEERIETSSSHGKPGSPPPPLLS